MSLCHGEEGGFHLITDFQPSRSLPMSEEVLVFEHLQNLSQSTQTKGLHCAFKWLSLIFFYQTKYQIYPDLSIQFNFVLQRQKIWLEHGSDNNFKVIPVQSAIPWGLHEQLNSWLMQNKSCFFSRYSSTVKTKTKVPRSWEGNGSVEHSQHMDDDLPMPVMSVYFSCFIQMFWPSVIKRPWLS